MQYQKAKSAAKQMLTRGPDLQKTILQTLKTCSDLVGSTLGPGGMSVVIEHQEPNMPPLVTKDGVTVFRNLGFRDSTAQVLMEAQRDAAVRTASEAGDGTTTATVLAEAFVRYTQAFCNQNPHISPQRVVRILKAEVEKLDKKILGMAQNPKLETEEGRRQLEAVAGISANGDDELAKAVMECFAIIGDEGNVTLTEAIGPSRYLVQKIEGYPVPIGFEDSCGPFYQKFVNDPGTQQCVLEKPSFVLYHGKLTDFNALYPVLSQIAGAVSDGQDVDGQKLTHNVVIVAAGYSETVLANLAAGFVMEGTLNVFPLLIPPSPLRTGAYDFLMDLSALTGGRIFDVIEYPLQNFQLADLGVGVQNFEAGRFRSNILGRRDDLLVLERVDQIQKQLEGIMVSELDKAQLRERVAKLTSGIAKLVVQGPSHGEIKEKRDRAEDAICAVRGAIKWGALPGGGAVLGEVSSWSFPPDGYTEDTAKVWSEVIAPSLREPIRRLYTNAGYSPEEADKMVTEVSYHHAYDVLNRKWVDPIEANLLDSVPAVRESLRNSVSIASLLGTCGGTVVFGRDLEVDRNEARDTADFIRNANVNEANERP